MAARWEEWGGKAVAARWAAVAARRVGGQWQRILALLRQKRVAKISPAVISYNAAASACEKDWQWEQGWTAVAARWEEW